MPYDALPKKKEYSVEEMRRALHYLARMMKAHPEAKKLVPVYKALKQQIEAAQDSDDILAEALALAEA